LGFAKKVTVTFWQGGEVRRNSPAFMSLAKPRYNVKKNNLYGYPAVAPNKKGAPKSAFLETMSGQNSLCRFVHIVITHDRA
jgi:hypothetical protein